MYECTCLNFGSYARVKRSAEFGESLFAGFKNHLGGLAAATSAVVYQYGINYVNAPYTPINANIAGVVNGMQDNQAKSKNLEILYKISNLKNNWNNNNANEFNPDLIKRAAMIIDNLEVQPEVFPTARDSIQIEYEKQTGEYLEFEIFEDKISVFSIDSDERENAYDIGCDITLMNGLVKSFYGW